MFPVNPDARLLSNQDIRTKDSTIASRTDCSLATGKEAEGHHFVIYQIKLMLT